MEIYFMVTLVQKTRIALMLLLALSFSKVSYSQVLKANCGNSDAYGQISAAGYGMELPDCKHNVKHITVKSDPTVGCAFAFTIHRDLDNDRCVNTDRQRLEIKMNESSAKLGTTRTYQWKVKLDAGYKANPSFCHIHQIKAEGGDAGAPIITLTTRAGSPDKLQVIYSAPSGKSGGGTLTSIDLAPFKGAWIQISETVTYSASAKYSLYIKRMSDGKVLLNYSKTSGLNFDRGADYYRPKYGIYRSLNDKSVLRDETLLYADFCYSKSSSTCYTKSAAEEEVTAAKPSAFGLQVGPNPIISNNAKMNFTLPAASNVKISVCSMTGQEVVLENSKLDAGEYSKDLDVTALSNGAYVLKIVAEDKIETAKIIVNKN
jgi:hypothetical protein